MSRNPSIPSEARSLHARADTSTTKVSPDRLGEKMHPPESSPHFLSTPSTETGHGPW